MPVTLHDFLHVEHLTIKGQLGLVPDCTLDIRPLTVLVGKQGTGKSLVAQVLYFFRDLPFLVAYQLARLDPANTAQAEPRALVRAALDGLRSSNRAFTVFSDPSATLTWKASGESLSFHMTAATRQIRPNQALTERVTKLKELANSGAATRSAVFIPTERLFYSQVRSPVAMQVLSLPTTFHLFAEWMELAGREHDGWPDGEPDTAEGRWVRDRGREALGGEGYRHGSIWKWCPSA